MPTFSLLVLLIALFYWDECSATCPAETGLPLDLNQFAGKWYMVAGIPVNGKSLSKCGYFIVTKISSTTFTAQYTALSYRDNKPVTFNVDGSVQHDVTGNWQLRGSNRILGPFKHIIISMDYGSYLAMVVCSKDDSSHRPGYKFAMIWSRERNLPPLILKKLKAKLAQYINEDDVLMTDHENC